MSKDFEHEEEIKKVDNEILESIKNFDFNDDETTDFLLYQVKRFDNKIKGSNDIDWSVMNSERWYRLICLIHQYMTFDNKFSRNRSIHPICDKINNENVIYNFKETLPEMTAMQHAFLLASICDDSTIFENYKNYKKEMKRKEKEEKEQEERDKKNFLKDLERKEIDEKYFKRRVDPNLRESVFSFSNVKRKTESKSNFNNESKEKEERNDERNKNVNVKNENNEKNIGEKENEEIAAKETVVKLKSDNEKIDNDSIKNKEDKTMKNEEEQDNNKKNEGKEIDDVKIKERIKYTKSDDFKKSPTTSSKSDLASK